MTWRCLCLTPLLALIVVGCRDIKQSAMLAQPLNKELVAGIGDAMVEIETRESLPNIAGNADIFGRTRPTGHVVVTYAGMEQGRAVFERHTVRLRSNATTMNSTPIIIQPSSTTTYAGTGSVSGTTAGGIFSANTVSSGTATTTAPPIVLPPSGSETQVISNERIGYSLDLAKDRVFIVEGHEILIEEATSSLVRYRISRLH